MVSPLEVQIVEAKVLQVRPTEKDAENAATIAQAHPEFASASDVLRHALQVAAQKARRELYAQA